jgi:hypothetical protein
MDNLIIVQLNLSSRISGFFWAHFQREALETGLSAPIPRPPAGGLRDFRFYPLRVSAGENSRFKTRSAACQFYGILKS